MDISIAELLGELRDSFPNLVTQDEIDCAERPINNEKMVPLCYLKSWEAGDYNSEPHLLVKKLLMLLDQPEHRVMIVGCTESQRRVISKLLVGQLWNTKVIFPESMPISLTGDTIKKILPQKELKDYLN